MGHPVEEADKFLDTLQDYLTVQQVAREFGLRMRGYKKRGNSFVAETDEGPKEVRRLRHTLDEYRFACDAAEFLRGQGFSRLPRATWAPSGSPIVNVGGAFYTMHDWVPGTQADLDNLCQLTQAVEMLAWFHRCGQGFRPGKPPAVREEWGACPRRFAGRIEEFYRLEEKARAEEEDRFAHYYLKYSGDFLSAAAKALEELEAGPYARIVETEREQGGLCHRDYTGRNLILRDDGALFLTDFDDLAMDTRLEDLGKFLVRQGRWDLERILFILHVYHGVTPLTRDEIACLVPYLRFPFEFWSLASAHFSGKKVDHRALKRLAEERAGREETIEGLRRADLSFLAGANALYSQGFAGLPEVPAGKAWSWPSAEGVAASEHEWRWQTLPEEPAAELPGEPPEACDEAGTVLEEAGGGGDSIWPEAAAEAAPPGPAPGEDLEPVLAAPEEPPDRREEAGGAGRAPRLTWRPFPAPLRRK